MTKLLDKEVEGIIDFLFDTEYMTGKQSNLTKENVRQSLTRYARAMVKEAMPEEETGQDSLEAMHPARAFKVGFNKCRTKFKENIEKLLGSKEDK